MGHVSEADDSAVADGALTIDFGSGDTLSIVGALFLDDMDLHVAGALSSSQARGMPRGTVGHR